MPQNNDAKGWTIKYYKGLGTSTSAEAKDYFSHLNVHEVDFAKLADDEKGGDLVDMAFSKARVDDRKIWLNNLKEDTYLDYSECKEEGVKVRADATKRCGLLRSFLTPNSNPKHITLVAVLRVHRQGACPLLPGR